MILLVSMPHADENVVISLAKGQHEEHTVWILATLLLVNVPHVKGNVMIFLVRKQRADQKVQMFRANKHVICAVATVNTHKDNDDAVQMVATSAQLGIHEAINREQ